MQLSQSNILTVLRTGGGYSEKHVTWLQKQLKQPIFCLTDSIVPMENVTTIPMQYIWPGWWSKMEMFRPDLGLATFLYTDLDQVFLNGVPQKYLELTKTTVLSDVSRKPRPTMNSGLMFIVRSECDKLWEDWTQYPKKHMTVFDKEGDQGFINTHLNYCQRWQTLFPKEIVSYKTDVQHYNTYKLTGKEKVILFHGKPKPWEITAYWNPKL